MSSALGLYSRLLRDLDKEGKGDLLWHPKYSSNVVNSSLKSVQSVRGVTRETPLTRFPKGICAEGRSASCQRLPFNSATPKYLIGF